MVSLRKLSPFLLLLILQCASKTTSIEDSYPYRKFYSAAENQNRQNIPSPYSHNVNDDLFTLYEKELEALSTTLPQEEDKRKEKIENIHQHFSKKNQQLLSQLRQTKLQPTHHFSKNEVEKLRQSISRHPLVGDAALAHFDPSAHIGFCFGRAAYVHLFLSKKQVPQIEMGKIFAFGKLRHQGFHWKFHMATLLLGKNPKTKGAEWWVIDALFNEVLEVGEWMKKVSQFSIFQELSDVRFYTTEAKKFQPFFGEYRSQDLQLVEYQRFFQKLGEYFETLK